MVFPALWYRLRIPSCFFVFVDGDRRELRGSWELTIPWGIVARDEDDRHLIPVESEGPLEFETSEVRKIYVKERGGDGGATKAGALAFLTKPLDADALLHAIEHAIGRSRATLGREREV